MFCPKCGTQLSDDATFCSNCGEVLNSAPAQEPIVEQNVEPVAPVAEPVAPASPAAENENATPVAKKKGKKLPLILAIAGGLVAVVAVLAVVFYGQLEGFVIKTFGSNDDYFKYVENKALEGYSDDVSQLYGVATDEYIGAAGKEMEYKINLSDEAYVLIEENADLDLSWIKNASIKMRTERKDGNTKADVSLNLSDKEILGIIALINANDGDGYITVKSLTDKYIKLDMGGLDEQQIYNDPEFEKLMPTDAELKELLKKYVKISIESIEDVEKSTKTITVEGMNEKVTVLTLHLDEEALKRIAENVLTELKKDEKIKEYIDGMAQYLVDKGLVNDEPEEAYEEFLDGIDEAIDDLSDWEYEGDEDGEDIVTLTNYVNSAHMIVGRVVEVEGEEILTYKVASKKDKLALYAEVENVVISGICTKSDDKINGTFDVEIESTSMFTVELVDFDVKNFKKGTPQGTVKLSLTEDAYEAMDLPSKAESIVSLLSPTLSITFDCNDSSTRIIAAVQNKDKDIVSVEMTVNDIDVSSVEMPDEEDVYPSDYTEEWAATLDMNKLFENLYEAGVPQEVLVLLQDYLMNLMV